MYGNTTTTVHVSITCTTMTTCTRSTVTKAFTATTCIKAIIVTRLQPCCGFDIKETTLFLKNIFYKNIEAQILEILRTF